MILPRLMILMDDLDGWLIIPFSSEHAARADVIGFYRHELLARQLLVALREQTVRLAWRSLARSSPLRTERALAK